jgi:glutamyl-tRNA reductase
MSREAPWLLAVKAGSADAEEREQIARSVQGTIGDHADWILLTTCHRVELYGFGDLPDLDAPLAAATGADAVHHLMRVAAGLDSAIIGEDEVLHQVRETLAGARATRPLDGRLQRLFETAIAAGRRARAGRTASSGNLAQKAVAWLQERSSLAGRTILVAGAGRMGASLAHSAKVAGAEVTIASRDTNRASKLAQVYGGRGIDLARGAELAPETAGIAVALGGIWHELKGELPPVADISAPQAVPADVRAKLNGAYLGIDDLYVRPRSIPRAYIDEAARVVSTKTAEYVRWLDGDDSPSPLQGEGRGEGRGTRSHEN